MPHRHSARVTWSRGNALFTDSRYSRGHKWTFDGGVTVRASSSPHVVRVPYSVEAAVDPEEAFVASLSSCHMLFFLSLSAEAGFVVDDYDDDAYGVMEKNDEGRLAMTEVVLRPRVVFAGKAPTPAELDGLHHRAHHDCFLANSVKTNVRVESGPSPA